MTRDDADAALPGRTKIVATVGPATSARPTLQAMVDAGVDVFRINFSHGTEVQRESFLSDIRSIESEIAGSIAVLADLCGPKIRVGMIEGGEVRLEPGQQLVIQRAPLEGTAQRISTTLAELVDFVKPGHRVLLSDGRLRLEAASIDPPDQFTCRVVVGGPLSSGKGVNVPDTDLPLSAMTEKDRDDLAWISQRAFDYVGLSFVRRASDVGELRQLLDAHGSRAHVIAKIEKPQALEDMDAIIRAADAIMVARGDLGVEMDFPSVPISQKIIARKCQAAAVPCIIATEMMESMIRSARPTRAEASDVANAVIDHADAVMLSAESAIGQFPVETVVAMRRTVLAAEAFLDQYGEPPMETISEPVTTAALAASIRTIMRIQRIRAIAVYTATGTTARLIAKNRPGCPILVLAPHSEVARRVALYYGTISHVVEPPRDALKVFDHAAALARQLGLAAAGDHVIVVAGHPIGVPGSTNGLVVQQVT